MRIFQILTTLSFGDAVSNDCIAISGLLDKNGYKNYIYAENVDKRISSSKVRKINRLPKLTKNDIVLYHLSTGTALNKKIKEYGGRKFVIYHNITPADFFVNYSGKLARLCASGHEETLDLKDTFEGGFCDSEFNRQQLISYGYKCPLKVRPILIPFEDYKKTPDSSVVLKMRADSDIKNILFVGRIAPNKCQEDIIRVLYAYRKLYPEDKIRLTLVGSSNGTEKYLTKLKSFAKVLDIEEGIFPGQISFPQILAYYSTADAFICMSEHEGFCVPLTEAMSFDVPILAYDSCAVPETMGGSGIIIKKKDPALAAAYLHEILYNDELRNVIIEEQRERLKDFSYEVVADQFIAILKEFIEA